MEALLFLLLLLLKPLPQAAEGGQAGGCFGTNLSAVVLSIHHHRFLHTRNILAQLNFDVMHEKPIGYDSPYLQELYNSLEMFKGIPLDQEWQRKTFSNYATFRRAIQGFANEPEELSCAEDWRFFFEDDIALHPGAPSPVCSIRRGMELARTEGIVYLGICGSACFPWNKELHQGVNFERCYGTCAHAFGVTKWKAGKILDTLLLLQKEMSAIQRLALDCGLFEYGRRIQPIFTIGTNLNRTHEIYGKNGANESIPGPDGDHSGIFYQDRKRYPTTIIY